MPPAIDEAPRILIVRLSALGDVIHALPCLDVLRRRFPKAFIGWVAEELSADLLRTHPQLDETFIIPKRRWRGRFLRYFFPEILPFIRRIRSRRFDVAIDFQGLTKSGLVARLSGAPIRIGYGGVDCREFNGLFTNRKIDPGAEVVHIIERNLCLLPALGIDERDYERVLPDEPEWRAHVADWLRGEQLEASTRFVAVNPGAGWETKRWPLERFAEVGARIAGELGRRVLLTWGPGEEGMVDEVARLMSERGARAWLAPPTTVGQSVALLRQCDLFIGGDTGPTHLAAAAGVPVVAIYGASDAERNHPGAARQVILQKADSCAPSSGFDGPCWKKAPPPGCEVQCLSAITPEEVFSGARRLLE